MLMRYFFAQRHIARSGAMIVFPKWVKEYSTATAFDLVTRFATNPADFEIAQSSGPHPLGHPSEKPPQLSMSIGLLFKRTQNLGVHRPRALENIAEWP